MTTARPEGRGGVEHTPMFLLGEQLITARPGLRLALQSLVEAYREQGHRCATLDPLGLASPVDPAQLDAAQFGLKLDEPTHELGAERASAQLAGHSWVLAASDVGDLQARLRACYCGEMTLDASAVRNPTRREWLFAAMEAEAPPDLQQREQALALLERLVAAQCWEQHAANSFPQGKRFSLQGLEALLPLLDAVLEAACAHGVEQVMMGMPHRGRLNVLVNLLGLPPERVLAAFELLTPASGKDSADGNDLIYHRGAERVLQTPHGPLRLRLADNPSHLQSVQPVICGMTRASQDGDDGPQRRRAMALLLHGDAALAGQGVVMETLMLAHKQGYGIGGAVHIVINNQVGFTEAQQPDAQAPRYCTDVARMIDAPVLRVNADAPELLARAAALALAYRSRFSADVFIDLVGYRRLGHSESDVPELSSPLRQACIKATPTVVERFARRLQAAGWLPGGDIATVLAPRQERALSLFSGAGQVPPEQPAPLPRALEGDARHPLPDQGDHAAMVEAMVALPPGFLPHPMVRTLIEDWRSMAGDRWQPVDWRFAENMAYASLLRAGVGIRISGMDVQRGTFFHRLAVWQGQTAAGGLPVRHVPLAALEQPGARFEVYNSPLSEEAVLGFEYGYSLCAGRRLVIWEAQFGDFVNGAQVFADQYIASGAAKWGRDSALVVLLPHGHEGVGPEHSNGFLGRWLALCAEENLRVACPSTSAQWFHLLRRQALDPERRPLIVMTPKAVLHEEPGSHAPLQAMLEGSFQPLLPDPDAPAARQVERVVLCSGKLFYDLVRGRRRLGGRSRTLLLRLEQLYPLDVQGLHRVLAALPWLGELVWAQEEQLRQGAWPFVRDDLQQACPAGVELRCVAAPSTATGAASTLQAQRAIQQALVEQALGWG
ncbi:2-oxoglutarate dehydrogenase E1 component [Paucibacter sp. APW11]|uniref:oxoglutarate dehydrogenase (succinyl-transferring) n=1 Tax=Roseateles aquae TaxID=3077235 RepID=A0ABU3P921_9BURK|nr:2-oxoglutarate dehydrogenase E1 component [Paucibacter sp. APW11]MDT8999066.1 2-oxoglutarate dehydrogenase E1 component [Paucibacter sp. APW11]